MINSPWDSAADTLPLCADAASYVRAGPPRPGTLGTTLWSWIGLDIEGFPIHRNFCLHWHWVTDRLQDIATVFGVADDPGQALG